MRNHLLFVILLSVILSFVPPSSPIAAAATFRPLEKVTDGAYQYRLSRTANAIMAFDSSDILHATYWAGGIDTRPEAPSRIFHRSWTAGGGWGAPATVDDSEVDGVGRVGGRHPSLAVTPDDAVWIVWADHRHCTSAGNWIDNVEIYADVRPGGGTFSSTDYRLTTTTAGTMGDNGYVPKIAASPTGGVSVAWHDYHFDANRSDIFLRSIAGIAELGLTPPMAQLRLTNAPAVGDAEYTVVDLAIDASGHRHLVWCEGQGAGGDLFYCDVDGANPAPVVVASAAADYFDPPHVAVSPAGEVWIAWGDETGPAEEVRLLRRRVGQSAFDPSLTIESDPARQYAPSLAIDSEGRVHLAWVDERAGRHVRYAVYDPASQTLSDPVQLTPETANWSRPSLLLDAQGEAYLLIEETRGIASGEIWFTTTRTVAAAQGWAAYR